MNDEIIKMESSLTDEEKLIAREFVAAYNRQLEKLVDHIYQKSRNGNIYTICKTVFDEVKERCKYDWENYRIYKNPNNTVKNNVVDIYFLTANGSIKQKTSIENSKSSALLYGKSYCLGFQLLVADVFNLLKNKYGKVIKFVNTNNEFHAWNTVKIDGAWYKFDTSGVYGDDYSNNFRKITSMDKLDIAAIKKAFPDENLLAANDELNLENREQNSSLGEEVLKMTHRNNSQKKIKNLAINAFADYENSKINKNGSGKRISIVLESRKNNR